MNYILGLLNSRLLSLYLRKEVTGYKKLFPQINQSHLQELPFPPLNPKEPTGKARHDRVVHLVERILALKHRIVAKGKAHDSEREELEREAAHTDREIDRAVYELYGLTQGEIAIVEGSG